MFTHQSAVTHAYHMPPDIALTCMHWLYVGDGDGGVGGDSCGCISSIMIIVVDSSC